MTKLSAEDIANLIKQNGGVAQAGQGMGTLRKPDTDGPIFIAIALAESGGETTATNKNPNGTTDYGLWQINSVHDSLLKTGAWSDPKANFRMAMVLYDSKGGKFTDWTTYKAGLYAPFLPAAQKAWNGTDTPAATPAEAAENAVTSTADFLNALTNQQLWIRVGMGIGGLLLIILTLAPMLKNHLPGPAGMAIRAASASKAGQTITEGAAA
jgi:hypothetical protein